MAFGGVQYQMKPEVRKVAYDTDLVPSRRRASRAAAYPSRDLVPTPTVDAVVRRGDCERAMPHPSLVAILGILIIALPAAAGSHGPAQKKLRHAKKILAEIRLVDGSGSGLDADSVQGLTPLIVRDANGTFVGAPLELTDDVNGAGIVIRRIGDRPFRFVVGASSLGGTERLFFESGDCAGQALLLAGRKANLLPDAVAASSQVVYYPAGSPEPHAAASLLRFSESPASCPPDVGTFVPPDGCCQHLPAPGISDSFVVPQTVNVSTLGLVPPFQLDVVPSPAPTSATATRP
jgi:hypothetical protein